jgi:iron complex outermembrane receptor protein
VAFRLSWAFCFIVMMWFGWTEVCFAEEPSPLPPLSSLAKERLEVERLYLQEERVVTAIRQEQPISQSPSNLYVITAADIRLSGATDIPTLLRRVPGMEVIQTSSSHFEVSVRGNNQQFANKLLFLIDGRSVYVDLQAVSPWTQIPVTLPEIKRIEVLKGPASAIYGFNAFDGVINIITKSADEMKGTTLQAGYGELGTLRSAAVHAGRTGNLSYRASIGRDQTQQWRDRNALAMQLNKFHVQTEYTLHDQATVKLTGGLVNAHRDDVASGSIVRVDSPVDRAHVELVYQRSNSFIRANWYGNDATVDNLVRQPLTPFITVTDKFGNPNDNTLRSNTYNIEAQYAHDLGAKHRLIGGLNYRLNTLSGTQVANYSQENRFGLYLQEEWRPTASLTLTAGGRIDLHNQINPTYSPRVALLYSPSSNHTFRVSGSVAYRSPTLIETNQQIVTTTTIFGFPTVTNTLGNHNLAPEQITSYEVGYQGWYFQHRVRLRTDLFFNHESNLISPIALSATQGSYRNEGSADIYGGEAGIEFLATPWLTGFANYAYQEIRQNIVSDFVRRGGPRFKVNAGLQGQWDNGFNAEASVHYVGAATYPVISTYATFAGLGLISPNDVPNQRVGSYALVNLRGGYRFWQNRAEAAMSVFNALNDKHREHPLADELGSRVMGWLTFHY